VDRRRILFSSGLEALAATVLMVLVHRAASCGAGGEAMRQLALTQRG
jgi:hypothetical protein